MFHAFDNPRDIFIQQGQLLHTLRQWFHRYGYQEVYTPALVFSPAMEEYLEAIAIEEQWLHTSPEFGMKKLLATGLNRIYQITPCYRKEEIGRHHSTEFRMLEWYRVGASMWDVMEETENLITELYQSIAKTAPVFSRISTTELLPPELPADEWFFRWVDEIEPNLPPACIVYDYPAWQSALARKRGHLCSRFEIYINGVELANAFDEEGNAKEIAERWKNSNRYRQENNKTPYPIDHNFLKALTKMPRCSGIAMGIDRLFMVLLELDSIQPLQIPHIS